MYLIEYKYGDYKVRKYIINDYMLEMFKKENPQYEYVRVLKHLPNTGKVMVKKLERGNKRKN